MAITIDKQPDLFGFIGNPLLLKLTSNNFIEQTGAQLVGSILVASLPTGGETFTLKWGQNEENEVTIYLITGTPDDSGDQVKIISETGDVPGFTYVLAEALNCHPILGQYYYFFDTPAGVTMSSLKKEAYYNITFSTNTSAVLSWLLQTAAVDLKYRDNFKLKVFLDYWLRGTQQVNAPAEASRSTIEISQPAIDSEAVFDLSDYLNNGQLKDPFPEAFNPTQIQAWGDAVFIYRFRTNEFYGIPGADKKTTCSTFKYAIAGGLEERVATEINLNNLLLLNRTILLQGQSRTFFDGQQEWLYYLHQLSSSSFDVMVTLFFANQPSTQHVLFSHTGVKQHTLYQIPVGQDVIESLQYFSLATSWEVFICKAGDPNTLHSQRVSYTPNAELLPAINHFAFRNSLGTYQIFTAKGKVDYHSNFEKEVTKKTIPADYNKSTPFENTHHSTISQTWKVNTGLLTKNEIDLFQDFLLSKQVYFIGKDYYHPVRIEAKKLPRYSSDRSSINTGVFEVVFNDQNKHFTND